MNVNPLHQESSKRLRSPSPTTKSALYDSDSDSDSDEKPSHPPPPPTPPTKKPKSDNPKKEKPPRVDMGAGEGVGEVVGHDEYGEWRSVPGFSPECLLASSKGFVRTRVGNRVGNPSQGCQNKQSGYWRCNIDCNMYRVHQLILRAFVGPRPSPSMTGDHANQDRSDNRFENLSWATKSEQNANRGERKQHRGGKPILVRCAEWPATTPSMWFAHGKIADRILGCKHLGVVANVNAQSRKFAGDKTGNKWLAQLAPALELQEDLLADPDYVDSNGDPKPQPVEVWVDAVYYGNRVHGWKVSNRARAQCKYRVGDKWEDKFTPQPTKGMGYAMIKSCKKQMSFHIVVVSSFHSALVKGMIIDHIDRNKANNFLSNLRVVSSSENNKNRDNKSHPNRYNAKKMAVEARREDAAAVTPWQEFESLRAAASFLKIRRESISDHLNGKRLHAGGYVFRRIE